MRLPRILPAGLVLAGLVLAGLVGVLVVACSPGHPVVRRGAAQAVATRSHSPTTRALAVLARWDQRRARAWRRGDPAALARLYASGSTAGDRDRAMLAGYLRRGLRVRTMHRQVLAVRVRRLTARRVVLVVTDRLVDAVVVGGGVGRALPDSRPRTRRIALARVHGRWVVTDVRPAARGQPAR